MLRSKFAVEKKGIIHEFGAIFEAVRCWLGQSSIAVRAWFCYNTYLEPEWMQRAE